MRDLTVQDKVAQRAYALTDKDSETILALIDRILDLYEDDEEPLSEDELRAFDDAYEHRNDPSYWTSAEDLKKELEACE